MVGVSRDLLSFICSALVYVIFFFFFQAEDGIRDYKVTGVQTCALPISLSFPSGRTAEEVVVDDAAGLAWIVNLGCIELHPHPVRTSDLDHPNELRVEIGRASCRERV